MKDHLQNLLKLQELEFGDITDDKLEKTISALRKKIPLPILEHYDRLTLRGKKGVAIVRNQVCTGCHMRIPIGAINTLMHGEDIQMCDTCARYLYLPPEARHELLEVSEVPRATGSGSRPKQKPMVCAT